MTRPTSTKSVIWQEWDTDDGSADNSKRSERSSVVINHNSPKQRVEISITNKAEVCHKVCHLDTTPNLPTVNWEETFREGPFFKYGVNRRTGAGAFNWVRVTRKEVLAQNT